MVLADQLGEGTRAHAHGKRRYEGRIRCLQLAIGILLRKEVVHT